MLKHTPDRVISGTEGEVWIEGDYMAEVVSLEAKITFDKQEVTQTKVRGKGYKQVGYDCKGTIKLNKVSSYFIKLLSDKTKQGKTVSVTIISNLSDPDALGSERIKLTGCTFDELPLISWEAGKLGEESLPFTFRDWEVIDSI